MNYRNVGKSGLKVSEIAVGSWMTDLVGSKKVDIARDTIKLAYENGINFLIVLMLTAAAKLRSF